MKQLMNILAAILTIGIVFTTTMVMIAIATQTPYTNVLDYAILDVIVFILSLASGIYVFDSLTPEKKNNISNLKYEWGDKIYFTKDGVGQFGVVQHHADRHIKVLCQDLSTVIIPELAVTTELKPEDIKLTEQEIGRFEHAKQFYNDCITSQRYELAAALKPYINQAENALDLFCRTADEGQLQE